VSDPPQSLPTVIPAADPELDALRRQIAETRAQVQDTVRVMDSGQKQEADDRSMITRVVIIVFGCSMLAVLAVIVLGSIMSQKYEDLGDKAVDLLKSTVLPIVTLVLGYYFGRAGKSN
jgi:type VI protein secretion system component VasF